MLLDSQDLRISALWGGSERLFVAFTGIGQALGGIQTEEFVGTASGSGADSVIFVTDLGRSWYNAPADMAAPGILQDAVRVTEAVIAARGIRGVVTIGNSMGGFGAIVFSTLTSVEAVISFAPQFSVHPRIVPSEKRWRTYTSAIAAFRHDDLSKSFVQGTRYYLFHGDGKEDAAQVRLFPAGERIRHILVPGADHDVARVLKQKGLLTPVVAHCVAGRDDALGQLLREEVRAYRPGEGRPRRWPFFI